MKYLLMVYASQKFFDDMSGADAVWGPEELAAMGEVMAELNTDLEKTGELVEAVGLAAPVHTRQIALRDGAPVVTDGPYAETQEVLAGYWLVDCEGFDRACEIAARLLRVPGPETVVDVRPIMGAEAAPEL